MKVEDVRVVADALGEGSANAGPHRAIKCSRLATYQGISNDMNPSTLFLGEGLLPMTC
jgi:hypothetical protein